MLDRASGRRTVDIGLLSSGGGVSTIPLELYVARVLAGEAEPGAADAAMQALAVAIRTYAIVNDGRHRREGFDLCDTTHCQVMRASNELSRRAALATAGRVLMLDGKPVEIFYSASCGGRSEGAADVWPGGTRFPYLLSVKDDVHNEDVPWVLEMTLDEIRQALVKAGFGGARLRDIDIDGRTSSWSCGAPAPLGSAAGCDRRRSVPHGYRCPSAAEHGVLDDPQWQPCAVHGPRIRTRRRHVRIGAGRRARRGETVERSSRSTFQNSRSNHSTRLRCTSRKRRRRSRPRQNRSLRRPRRASSFACQRDPR